MDRKAVRLWYDPAGDRLEVIFEKAEGFFRATENEQVMERVTEDGRVLGFSIDGVSTLRRRPPLDVAL